MTNEYIKYITSLECQFLRNDKANQSELVAEEYLGVYKGKNFDELYNELQRRNNEIQKNICTFKLESSKEYALCMCLKELLFFYLGFRYIVKTKEKFLITDEMRVKIGEAITVCNEGVSTKAISVIYNFIASLDEKFCSTCLDEIIQMLRWKLEMASPYSESVPENIYGHYRTVIDRVEEICLECGISKRLPKKNLFNKNSRYIGVVKHVADDGIYINLLLGGTNGSILQLGHNRFEGKKQICELYGIHHDDLDDFASYFVPISNINSKPICKNQYVEVYFCEKSKTVYEQYLFKMIKPN